MHLLLVTVASAALVVMVSAHPTGAPIEACGNFEAKHHEDKDESNPKHQPQTGPAPFTITFNPTQVAPGGVVQLTIQGGGNFKGFMIQGNDKNTGKIVGSFRSGGKSQTLNCPGGAAGNTATHTESSDKNVVTLNWQAPNESGEVVFKGTIVQNYEKFWYNVRSGVLTVG